MLIEDLIQNVHKTVCAFGIAGCVILAGCDIDAKTITAGSDSYRFSVREGEMGDEVSASARVSGRAYDDHFLFATGRGRADVDRIRKVTHGGVPLIVLDPSASDEARPAILVADLGEAGVWPVDEVDILTLFASDGAVTIEEVFEGSAYIPFTYADMRKY